MVESGLLFMALAKLSEHEAEASDSALLDGTERKAPVLISGPLGSAASFLISCLGPTHWEGREHVFLKPRPRPYTEQTRIGPGAWGLSQDSRDSSTWAA